jgi:hypothetical protein
MDIRPALLSQYHAALSMLRQAIQKCPHALWADTGYSNAFWHIAYHTLVYTHFYLHPSEKDFVPWEKFRKELRSFELPTENIEPYTKTELLGFLDLCLRFMETQVEKVDLSAPSGFHWLPFNKLELQFYNIRHIMQHTGELSERLGAHGEIQVGWVGRKA